MIEILVLIRFSKMLAAMARQKNRSSSWAALGAIFWIGGEATGFVIGIVTRHDDLGLYGFALAGAALGALTAYLIVKSLSEIPFDNGLPRARVI